MADNGAGIQELQVQMMQMIQNLSNEVQILKQDRQADRLRAQLQSQVNPPSPIAPSPVWSGSACAGFPDNFNIATPPTKPDKGKKLDPPFLGDQFSQQSIPLKPSQQPSSAGSSASSTTTVGGGGGGSSGASGFHVGSSSSSRFRSAGVGSAKVVMTERERDI